MWVVVEASVELLVTQEGEKEGSCADNGSESTETVLHCFGEGLPCHKHLQWEVGGGGWEHRQTA